MLCALEVSAPTAGGRLTITTRDTTRRRRTALVGAGGRYRVLSRSRGDGPEQTFSLTLRRGQLRRLIVVEHPAGLAPADVIGLLPAPDVFWQPARARGPRRMKPPSARALPPPEAAMREMALEALPEAEPVPPPPAAAMAEAPPPAEPVFAQVGASMPATVHLDDAVPVEVRLSRGEVHIVAGRSHDEQVIVMDPGQPLDVTLLRRGFALDPPRDRAAQPEAARRGCERRQGRLLAARCAGGGRRGPGHRPTATGTTPGHPPPHRHRAGALGGARRPRDRGGSRGGGQHGTASRRSRPA